MALIICPECEREISDMAESCPGCGYPIQKYLETHIEKEIVQIEPKHQKVESQLYSAEVKRLTDKIKKIPYTVPSPRAKVCIKCGRTFGYCSDPADKRHNKPKCKCCVDGIHMPGFEVDYPQQQATTIYAERYIWDKCVVPMNIGDRESDEYKIQKIKVLNRKEHSDKKSPKSARRPHPEPPDEKWFGKTSSTPQEEQRNMKMEQARQTVLKNQVRRFEPTSRLPHCPFCSSTDLTKISSLGKAVKIWAFGLYGMDDAGKTYKCNNCGGKF